MGSSTIEMQGTAPDAKQKRAQRIMLKQCYRSKDNSKPYMRKLGEGRRISEEVGTRRLIPVRQAVNGLAAGGIITAHVSETLLAHKPYKGVDTNIGRVFIATPGTIDERRRPVRTKCKNQMCSCRGLTPLGAAK